MSPREYGNIFFFNEHLERVSPISRYADKEPLEVKHYLNSEVIGYFPDFNVSRYGGKIIGGARKSKKRWNGLNKSDKVEILEQLGEALCKNGEYDNLVARAGGFPISGVRKVRKEFGKYLKQADLLIEQNPGRGPLVAATSVTTPHVQKWAIVEGLLGNASVTIKGDGEEPFSAYEMAKLAGEFKPTPPIQFITYKHEGLNSNFASQLYNELCVKDGGYFMLMGNPETARKIGYGNQYQNIKGFPPNMFSFISHSAAMIVDKSADIDAAVEGAIRSFEFPKACKVPTIILVHEDSVDAYADKLEGRVKAQKVGDVTDEETDVAKVSEAYWYDLVDPFLRTAKSGAEILCGGKINEPTILLGNFYDSTILEPHYPIYCIEGYEDLKQAIDKINMMGNESPKGKILDLSIYTQDEELEERLIALYWSEDLNAFSLHFNLPTLTFGTAHEGVIPRKKLAKDNFVDYAPEDEFVPVTVEDSTLQPVKA